MSGIHFSASLTANLGMDPGHSVPKNGTKFRDDKHEDDKHDGSQYIVYNLSDSSE